MTNTPAPEPNPDQRAARPRTDAEASAFAAEFVDTLFGYTVGDTSVLDRAEAMVCTGSPAAAELAESRPRTQEMIEQSSGGVIVRQPVTTQILRRERRDAIVVRVTAEIEAVDDSVPDPYTEIVVVDVTVADRQSLCVLSFEQCEMDCFGPS